jgi:DNA-binding NarL/FixJ family response regulator
MSTNYAKVRIIISDDHAVFLRGMAEFIRNNEGFTLVGQCTDPDQLFTQVEEKQPDIIITALHLKEFDPTEAIKNISEKYPQIGIIAFSTFHDLHQIIPIAHAGVNAYLMRSATERDIMAAINAVSNSEGYYPSELGMRAANFIIRADIDAYPAKGDTSLTKKDKEFLRLVCQEYTLKEIAERTNCEIRTLEWRKNTLYDKLNKRNVAGLINYAILNGIYDPFDINHIPAKQC